jgi:DNA-binding response OmpR family regulator
MAERAPRQQTPTRILLADDEETIQTLLTYPLEKDGYEVVTAGDGREALDRFAQEQFDLVIVDVMMPRLDGLEVCRRIRARANVPIIMLTAKGEEEDRVRGLDIGADDYITKPFSLREFRSRVRAALRRAAMPAQASDALDPVGDLRAHELVINRDKRSAHVRGTEVALTFVEFEILDALARAPGIVFSREQLLTLVRGDSAYRDPRTIDVHIRHLREKIETDPREPEYLFTVRGAGYRFRDEEPGPGS